MTPIGAPNSATSFPRTAILGLGSMGGAILQGLLAPTAQVPQPLRITTHSRASADALRATQTFDASQVLVTALEENEAANREAVRGAGVVILGVKPAMIHDLLRDIAGDLEPGTVVVSVAAGITLASMEALVPRGVAVVRAMPNTPSLVGRGVTGIVAGDTATEADLELTTALFTTVGQVLVVGSEAKLDALTAVSGSGPAYVFFFIEKFTEAAQRLGFSPDEASLLARGTFSGATALMQQTGADPAEMRAAVTSPNGTTAHAIAQLEAANFDAILDQALGAAVARARELAGGNP